MPDPHTLAEVQLAELLAEKPQVIRRREGRRGRRRLSMWEQDEDRLMLLDVELSTAGLHRGQDSEEVCWEPFTFIIDEHYPHRPPGVRVAAGDDGR